MGCSGTTRPHLDPASDRLNTSKGSEGVFTLLKDHFFDSIELRFAFMTFVITIIITLFLSVNSLK